MATTTDHGRAVVQLLFATRSGWSRWGRAGSKVWWAEHDGQRYSIQLPAHAAEPAWIINGHDPNGLVIWTYRATDPDMVWWDSPIPSAMDELIRLI